MLHQFTQVTDNIIRTAAMILLQLWGLNLRNNQLEHQIMKYVSQVRNSIRKNIKLKDHADQNKRNGPDNLAKVEAEAEKESNPKQRWTINKLTLIYKYSSKNVNLINLTTIPLPHKTLFIIVLKECKDYKLKTHLISLNLATLNLTIKLTVK